MRLRVLIILLMCSVFSNRIYSLETWISPFDPHVRYTGRIDYRNPDVIRFDWPGVSVEMLFEGTTCEVEMKGAGESFNVFVDGHLVNVLKTDFYMKRHKLVSGLSDTVHRLMITKRFEHQRAVTELKGFCLDSARYLKPLPARPPYRIEFLGASSVNGFGIESGTLYCDSVKISDFSNCYYSYGPVACRALNAECLIIAVTGKGLVRNWGSPFISWHDAFQQYYFRTLQNEPEPLWNHQNWIPHVVVINFGGNDFSSKPNPPPILFVNAYWSLLQTIYSRYPDVEIVCLAPDNESIKSIVMALVKDEKSVGNEKIHFMAIDPILMDERGCDWHPNVNAHKKIAKKLINIIRPILEKKHDNCNTLR